jgi:hypothetical protein
MFWMLALFGRRGGMPSKRPFRELARQDWLRSRISDSESSLKAEMLLAERVTPRRRLLVPHPMQELTSHGASFCFWLGFHYRSIEIAPYGGTVGGVDKAKISVEDPPLSFRAVSLFSPFSAFVVSFLHRRFESGFCPQIYWLWSRWLLIEARARSWSLPCNRLTSAGTFRNR